MEKIKNLIHMIKLKWLKDTLMTAILISILVGLFIAINVLVGIWNPSDIDVTEEGVYRLTDESKEIISKLPKEDKFEIYMFDYEEDNPLVNFVREYSRVNQNISVEIVNSEERPDMVSKYEIPGNYGYIVIARGERNVKVSYYDLQDVNQMTGDSTDITEQRFTNGIVGLSSIGKVRHIYELTGHGEISLKSEMTLLKNYLELENYEMQELDILKTLNVPDDCDTLLIASPSKDISEFESDMLRAYINRGGNILWLCNPYSAEAETPNLDAVLNLFGVTMRQDGFMLEQDTSKMLLNVPDLIIPTVGYSEVTSEVSNVLLLDSGRLEIVNDEELTELACKKTDLLTSSKTAFFRTDLALGVYGKSDKENAEETLLGCLMEKSVQEGKATSKLIVIANNLFAQDQAIPTGNYERAAIGFYDNMDFVLDCASYLSDVKDNMIIRKDIKLIPYSPTGTQDMIIKIVIFAIPVLIIISGIVVWTLRRRKC